MEYRQVNRNDIIQFVENRIMFATSIRQISDVTAFKLTTRQYIENHIEKDDLVIFLAIHNGIIASSCMACIFQTAPLPSCLSGKTAELLNVFTLPEYRKQGHAEVIVRMLLEKLKERGVEKILLDYTDMGFPLYKKLGFVPLEKQMQLKL